MSEHLRRAVIHQAAMAVLTLAIPLAWAAGRLAAIGRRIRYGRPRIPGLPEDGEPLDPYEAVMLIGIDRGERSRT